MNCIVSASVTFYVSEYAGVYCFPSRAARLANPKNVSFHLTREDAERVGFRPCKRCKPDQGGGKRQSVAGEIQFAINEPSLDLVLVAQSTWGICAVLFGDDHGALRSDLQGRFPGATLVGGDAKLGALAASVVAYVESPVGSLDVPLDMRGTEFQRTVWQALREIPAGATASYTDIANHIGLPKAARAVAQAYAVNARAVVIPCHRVVKSDGALYGYRWGVGRKKTLLEREAAA